MAYIDSDEPSHVSPGPASAYVTIMHRMEPQPVTREALARDIMLKLMDWHAAEQAAHITARSEYKPLPARDMAFVAVGYADALLAELAKGKEGP